VGQEELRKKVRGTLFSAVHGRNVELIADVFSEKLIKERPIVFPAEGERQTVFTVA